MLTGIVRTKDWPVTRQQIKDWEAGALIQDVMPKLADDDRKFVKTGIVAEEWAALGGKE